MVPTVLTTPKCVAAGYYALAIGSDAQALAPWSVALGKGAIATKENEVVIGLFEGLCPLTYNESWTLWNSPGFLLFLAKHRAHHTEKEFAAMVEWLEYYFHGSRMLSLPKME